MSELLVRFVGMAKGNRGILISSVQFYFGCLISECDLLMPFSASWPPLKMNKGLRASCGPKGPAVRGIEQLGGVRGSMRALIEALGFSWWELFVMRPLLLSV